MKNLNNFNIAKIKSRFQTIGFLFFLCFAPTAIRAQTNELKIPAEVKPFIGKDANAIALESADLNGDGTTDFILVTEPQMAKNQ